MDAVDDIREIQRYLPHRYPFLLVDRVTAHEPGVSLAAYKNITFNEPVFTGHFPRSPVFPGVLILEGLAQAAALLAFKDRFAAGEGYPNERTLYLYAGVDRARFRRQVVPGDRLEYSVTLERERRGILVFDARASVEGHVACTAGIMIARNELADDRSPE